MIDRRQLAEALGRLDPRDREILGYSLRRHVPDEDLAAVFGVGPSEVARLRAAAVERLADDLGVQRGADLGHVLTALLEAQTWEGVTAASGGPEGEDAGTTAAAAEDAGGAGAGDVEGSGAGTEAGGSSSGAPVADARPQADVPAPEDRAPVLDMLAGDGDPVRERYDAPSGGRRIWPVVAAAVATLLVAVGLGAVLVLGGEAGQSAAADEDETRPFVPREQEIGEPFPSDPASAYRYPVAIVEETTVLLDAPRGKPKVKIAPKTEWDSPRVLGVVEREGDWLSVLVPELPNGEVGWVHEDEVARLDTVGWAVKADLARRTVEVERDGEVVRRFEVGVGRSDHPTPTGRYAVTDKLQVSDSGSPYGCCVVALTGHQPKLPPGWPGGDRLAIHATADLSGLGEAVSLGCLRVHPKDARWLLDALPLGAPVFIEAGGEAAPRETKPRPKRKTSQGKRGKRS